MAITLEQAKSLAYRQTLYHDTHRNADGTAQRWRVNGKVKTWKTRPNDIQIPLKHGLYSYGYLTQDDLDLVHLSDPTREEDN